jgi:hypothetical protein
MYNQYDIQIMFAMRAWINEGETLAVDVLGPKHHLVQSLRIPT